MKTEEEEDKKEQHSPKEIKYITGDATNPIGDGQKVITHICNDLGKWGSGFVRSLSKKWESPEYMYRAWWYNSKHQEALQEFKLGNIQFVQVSINIHVVNMIAQRGINKRGEKQDRVDYEALRECLTKLKNPVIISEGFSIHMPKIGSGLARGNWDKIRKIIEEILCADGMDVYVYELRG